MSEADRIAVGRKACLGAGVNVITGFDDGITESEFLTEWYELIVEAELSLHKWRFATKTEPLPLLVEIPDTHYNTAHAAPADVLSVDTVFSQHRPVTYDRHQQQIHTNDTSADALFIKYRFRADETAWNPYFTLLVVYRLATMMSFSIARKEKVAESMKGLADQHFKWAKREDSQAQTNQKVNLRKLIRARGGSMDKFWRDR